MFSRKGFTFSLRVECASGVLQTQSVAQGRARVAFTARGRLPSIGGLHQSAGGAGARQRANAVEPDPAADDATRVRTASGLAGPPEQQPAADRGRGAGRGRRDLVGRVVLGVLVEPAVHGLVASAPEPAVQVHGVRQGVRVQARAAEPRAHAHGRETVRVLGVQEVLHARPPSQDARAAAHGREAVLVPALQPVLRAGGQPAPAPQDAHRRKLVPVRVLRRVLRDGRRAQGPQAPA